VDIDEENLEQIEKKKFKFPDFPLEFKFDTPEEQRSLLNFRQQN
jgi:hypothetical protein